MMNKTESSNMAVGGADEHPTKRKISVFWLVVGGLLVFLGVESILYNANIWTKTDVEYADDLVLVGLGALIIAEAVR